MKILLLQPPIEDFYDTAARLQPLGLCMLKSAAEHNLRGVEVVVRDFHQGQGREEIPVPFELSYLREYYPYPDSSPFSAFHGYYHFGASYERIALEVERESPDLIGISSLFSPYHREAAACAREIRKRTNKPIVMGGSHVSASPRSVLADPNVDLIVCGEGERSFVELIKVLRTGGPYEQVPGLGYKKGGELILNPPGKNYDIERLPFPDFSDLPPERYALGKRPLCFVMTSRGCPHQCTFCSVHLTFTEGFRRRSPEHAILELERRYEEGYRAFDFEDDNLTFNKKDFLHLLNLIIRRWPHSEVVLAAMNGISYQSLDPEVLMLMKRAGFREINISLVSAEPGSLTRLNRPHTLKKFLEIVHQAHSLGLRVVSYQIIGLPFETLDAMIETMALLVRLPVLIGVSIFYLTPGSAMAKACPSQSEPDHFSARSTAMAVETEHFRRDDLYTLFVTARIMNFLKGLKLGGNELSLEQAVEHAGNGGGRARTGSELLRRLLAERKLYAETPKGLRLLPRFRPDLFFNVLRKAGHIRTREGAVVVA